ncbi:MAG TPA: hypothetical protein VFQ06_11670, partial [Nitrospira sp.]|nr:hypothetical protein [Nitrospira sp.]
FSQQCLPDALRNGEIRGTSRLIEWRDRLWLFPHSSVAIVWRYSSRLFFGSLLRRWCLSR